MLDVATYSKRNDCVVQLKYSDTIFSHERGVPITLCKFLNSLHYNVWHNKILCCLAPTELGDVMFSALMVTFPMGTATGIEMCITVTGITDMSAEGNEVVAVTIVPSADYSVDAPGGFSATASINVLDNDGECS